MKLFAILLLAATGAAQAADADLQYELRIVRARQTLKMVASRHWPSEYPSPVIDTGFGTRGSKTVQAYAGVRTLGATRACTINNGLYHPWSRGEQLGSEAQYYYLTDSVKLRLKKSYDYEEYTPGQEENNVLHLPRGFVFSRIVYLSEGTYSAVGTYNGALKEFNLDDGTLSDTELFEQIEGPSRTDQNATRHDEQWVRLRCNEGNWSWIRDSAFLASPGVKEGEVTGFGDIGPAQPPQTGGGGGGGGR